MMSLSCKDMGMADCDFVATGETAEDAVAASMAHGMEAHGMTEADMTDEKKAAALAAVKMA